MASGLLVRVLSNSSCEDALGWKCINLQGMNLEIQVINAGQDKVFVRSEVELVSDAGSERIDYLFPHGLHPLGPEQAMSFYCSFDEERMKGFSQILITDKQGNQYSAKITGRAEKAEKYNS